MTWHRDTCPGPVLSFWAGQQEDMVTCLACSISKPTAVAQRMDETLVVDEPRPPAPAPARLAKLVIPPCPVRTRRDWPTHKARARARRHAATAARRLSRRNKTTTKKETP